MAQLDDVFIAPPTATGGFLYVARQMLDGALTLHDATHEKSLPVTHLCGHAAETALKAALSKCGLSQDELKSRKFGHSLEALWSRAAAEGVPLPQMPEWLVHLDRVHNAPYSLRYPLTFHAILLPNQPDMLAGCAALLSQAEALCK